MQLCSPAEMRAPFKLNLFVFYNVQRRSPKMDLYFKCVFLLRVWVFFFKSIGHHCVSGAQTFLQEKFVPRYNIQTFIYII